ncbi:MAG: ParB N-terminal domain-containing protein [Clostridiales bacterium]|nr:ParB N-terminal domain-containing protein [Candidatus Blautia equi]
MARDLQKQTLGLKKTLASTGKAAEKKKAGLAATNVDQLPEDIKNSIVYVKDQDLLDDPMNTEYYGETDVTSLADIIKRNGFQGVILAYPKDGKYMIESGHRRRMAGRKAGLKEFPVYVTEAPEHEWTRVIRLLGANDHDRKETPMMLAKVAEGYFNAHDAEIKYKKENNLLEPGEVTSIIDLVAMDMEVDPASVSRYRALLKLTPALQKMADEQTVSWSALAQAATLNKDYQNELFISIKQKMEADGQDVVKRAWIEGMIKKFRLFQQQGQKPEDTLSVKTPVVTDLPEVKKYYSAKSVVSQTQKYKEWLEGGELNLRRGDSEKIVQSLTELRESLDAMIKKLGK